MVDLSKLSSNKHILSGVVDLSYNKVCCQTFNMSYHLCLFSLGNDFV